MENVRNLTAETPKRFWNKKRRRGLFITLMLAYPVAHFLFFWIFINFDSILLSFQDLVSPNEFDYEAGAATWQLIGFKHYRNLFQEISVNRYTQQMIWNSLSYFVLNVGVILPLSLLASFVMFKRIPASGFFRVMFFLPSIIPLAALTIAFKAMLDSEQGSLVLLLNVLGIKNVAFMAPASHSQMTIYLFMIWSGMGYNIILLSSAMARLPLEVLESGRLDGVKGLRELVQIYVPLIWPNITTMVVLGLMSTFGVALQPLMISGGTPNETIGLRIYTRSQGDETGLPAIAALGIVCTLILAPVVLVVKWLMERKHKDVSF